MFHLKFSFKAVPRTFFHEGKCPKFTMVLHPLHFTSCFISNLSGNADFQLCCSRQKSLLLFSFFALDDWSLNITTPPKGCSEGVGLQKKSCMGMGLKENLNHFACLGSSSSPKSLGRGNYKEGCSGDWELACDGFIVYASYPVTLYGELAPKVSELT